jgi:hypothetical protein
VLAALFNLFGANSAVSPADKGTCAPRLAFSSADRYDDGGYSGGTLERPALQRLIQNIEAGKVQCVVVYKIDRLSLSLLNFTRRIDLLERHLRPSEALRPWNVEARLREPRQVVLQRRRYPARLGP